MNTLPNVDNIETKELLANIKEINTFSGVHEWEGRVQEETERLRSIIRGLDVEIARNTQELENLRYEQSKKMFGKLMGKSNEEKKFLAKLEEFKAAKSAMKSAIDELQDFMDFTPKTPEQKEELLKELRLHKKELQEKKREITQVVRSPRMIKKQEPANSVFDVESISRRKAHYEHDSHLLPNETTSDALSRQIAWIDETISRVEVFD